MYIRNNYGLALCILLALGGCAQSNGLEERWIAYIDNGDKPGNAYVLQRKSETVIGAFYLTDPNNPRDLSKGQKYGMKMERLNNSDFLASVTVIDGAGQEYPMSFTIHLNSELTGESVTAKLWSNDNKNAVEQITFLRSK